MPWQYPTDGWFSAYLLVKKEKKIWITATKMGKWAMKEGQELKYFYAENVLP